MEKGITLKISSSRRGWGKGRGVRDTFIDLMSVVSRRGVKWNWVRLGRQ